MRNPHFGQAIGRAGFFSFPLVPNFVRQRFRMAQL
jgi:hypothetical protein